MKLSFIHIGMECLAFEVFSAILLKSFPEIEQKLFFHYARFWNSQDLKTSDRIRRRIATELEMYGPDICCFSAYTDTYPVMSKIAKDVKIYNPSTVNIFGGIHATLLKSYLLKDNPFIDIVAIGEAEDTFAELMMEFVGGDRRIDRIKGISYRQGRNIVSTEFRSGLIGLDEIPFPNKEIFLEYLPDVYGAYLIMTGRGCPHNCTYCSSQYLKGLYNSKQYLRRRSVQNIIEELNLVKDQCHQIVFTDDVFLGSMTFLEEFLPAYKENIGLPFFCYSSPIFCDEQRLDLLKEAGCGRIGVGVQSGSERLRRNYFKRRGSNKDIIKTAGLIRARGIKFSADIILGTPYETVEDMHETLMLLSEIKPDLVQIFYLSYYPGLEITEMSLRDGHISNSDYEMIKAGTFQQNYHVGSFLTGKALKNARQAALMCHLITFLPKKLCRWLIKKRLYRMFPKGFSWHLLCYMLSTLGDKNRLFFLFQEIKVRVKKIGAK